MSQGNIDVPVQVEAPDNCVPTVCTVLQILERVSGKWCIAILLEAAKGPVRFTQLEHAIHGISRRMLTLTLRNLERDGLLVRKVYATVPPKVEYTATTMASELHDSLVGLTEWAQRHRGTIAAARDAYDRASAGENVN